MIHFFEKKIGENYVSGKLQGYLRGRRVDVRPSLAAILAS